MKKATLFLMFLALVSCWSEEKTASTATTVSPVEQVTIVEEPTTIEAVTNATESIWTGSWNTLSKINADYTNPRWAVDMVIEYSLDEEWNISEINTQASRYDLAQFNEKVQDVVWKSLEEASTTYFSGSSLTTEAFQKAIKSEISK